ncbi:phosphoribosyltransferase [Paraburkholderia phosphatilytica]|uniref:phosphoribosyltransferase n=1 Tax=Paraburkholderia phosphatilytica TaxID=2282883 RepID=UPI000E4BCB72|nr:phosphoribosyltransferase family protein [Paraburkholderia phosphatilytica]
MDWERPFANRADAGRELARLLTHYAARSDVIVLALPRGGVPVAFEVAKALAAPLDLLVVRKLGVPYQPELAMGAIASGGALYVDRHLVRDACVDTAQFDAVLARERGELARREAQYRGTRAPLAVADRVAIVVDDGMATGASLRAAALALRARGETDRPVKIVAALPVAPYSAAARIGDTVDEFVCVKTPMRFISVGQYYVDFQQTEDDEVRALLDAARC